MSPEQTLVYWIHEREKIRQAKEAGDPKPWSQDPVFQETYFCNVHREDDKVTKWIRQNLSQFLDREDFPAIMCLARMLNWPPTLQILLDEDIIPNFDSEAFVRVLRKVADAGTKVWGNAYVVTTHGRPMGKLEYAGEALEAAWQAAPYLALGPTLAHAHEALQSLEGFASFMAAQVVADLKYTPGHNLNSAEDWWTFAALGPGSVKGLNYYFGRDPAKGMSQSQFLTELGVVRFDVMHNPYGMEIPQMCNQDLQNCMCEYSKYMRISRGEGRSKRKYDGR